MTASARAARSVVAVLAVVAGPLSVHPLGARRGRPVLNANA